MPGHYAPLRPQSAADSAPVDFEALKPHSAAASAKDRGYVPAPAASDAVRTAGTQQAAAAATAASGDENMAPAAGQPGDAAAQAQRINAAMSRPGPSVRAEDMSMAEAPFAGHVPLEKPSKYRCALRRAGSCMHARLIAVCWACDVRRTHPCAACVLVASTSALHVTKGSGCVQQVP